MTMKLLVLVGLLLFASMTHSQQQPGVNCVPVQGEGWQGCAPIDNSAQGQTRSKTPPQRWADYWGAMVSDDSLGKLGVSNNVLNEAQAWQVAEDDCHAKGGSNCIHLISYRNECVAMVLGDKTYSFADATTASGAVQQAKERCLESTNNCHVYYSACSLPVRIQ